jgi:signal transduction histidine kinase/ligand-binding sensor domain-containing protein
MRFVCNLSLAFVCLLGATGLFAATAKDARALNELSLRSWNADRGLPNNSVLSLGRTRDGMLWVGTWEGLTRFDGTHFRNFNRINTPAINADGIRSLAPTATGGLWVGTSGGGLLRIEDNRLEPVFAPGQAFGLQMVSLLEVDGVLWMGLEGGGLYRMPVGATQPTRAGSPLIEGNTAVHTIVAAAEGGVVVATRDQVFRVDQAGTSVRQVGLPSSEQPLSIGSLLTSPEGALWVSTSHGIFHQRGQGEDWTQIDAGSGFRMAWGADGEIWVGTITRGLVRIKGERIERLERFHGAPDGYVSTLLPDTEGGIWFGTNGGLMRLQAMAFRSISAEHGLSNDYTRSVLQTRDGAIWVATADGLNRFSPGSNDAPEPVSAFGPTAIMSLAEAPDGALWAGTYTEGIFILRNGKKEVPENLKLPPTKGIRSILVARDQTIWVGTTRWVAHYDPARQIMLPSPPGSYSTVFALHEDRAGRIWVACTEGLARIDGADVVYFGASDGFVATSTFAFHEEADGSLWVGTDAGIAHYADGRFRFVSAQQGMPFHTVFAIGEDDVGQLWLTSRIGVFRVALAQLQRALSDPAYVLQGQLFDRDDGMGASQNNGTTTPTVLRAASGELWFATAKGVAIVDPEHAVSTTPRPLHVVLDRVVIDDHDVDYRRHHRLDPGRHSVSLQFAAAAPSGGGEIEYAYRVNGLDQNWEMIGSERSVRLTNLPPGAYVIEVASRMGHGPLSPEPARFSFEIAPRFWQIRGFIPLTVVLFGLVVFCVFWARGAALRSRNQRLEQEVAERTRELSQSNASLQTEVGERIAAETALKGRNDDLAALNEKLAGAQSQLLQSEKMASVGQLAAGVAHEINNPLGFVRANLHTLRRYSIELISALRAYARFETAVGPSHAAWQQLQQERKDIDLDYLAKDTPALIAESTDGVDRIARIVDELRKFSRVDDTDWQLADINLALDATLAVLAHTLNGRAEVIKRYGQIPLIECLPFQINQVLMNLLINAGQAVSEDGLIEIETGCDHEEAWIRISDNGTGIAEDHMPRIFEPFFTTRAVGTGKGLGLSVAYAIMQRHGGRIEVTSTPGQGSCFTLYLPVHREHPMEPGNH